MQPGSDILWIFGLSLVVIIGAIALIDLKRMIIPNALNAALVVSGLGFQYASQSKFPLLAIVGALSLTAVFYAIRAIYLSTRGVVGLGLGDVKMAGASAVWLNPANLPVFIFISCASALISLGVFGRHNSQFRSSGRLPFGPFLGVGLLASWCMENFTNLGLLAR
ncbi:prepilin peptidase [Hoeflea sp. TYP-13]|uniref:prepilin peptidase n=1 Tax=Hoeflea sp. TYP-13 TaxID=3230023 RepID=UPI0034C6ABCA